LQNKFKLKPQTQLDRIGRLKNKMSRFKNTPTKCKEPRTTAPERNFRFKLKPRTQLDRIERLNNQDSRTDLQSPKTKEPRPQKETAEQAQAQTPQQAAVLGRKPTSIPTLSSSAAEPTVSWRSATGLRAPASRPALSCSRNCYLLGGVGYGLLGAAAGNAGRPTYRRRRDRNVDRNHHRVHAGVRVGVSRGAVAGSLLPRRCGGFARGEQGRDEAVGGAAEANWGGPVRPRSSHVPSSDGQH